MKYMDKIPTWTVSPTLDPNYKHKSIFKYWVIELSGHTKNSWVKCANTYNTKEEAIRMCDRGKNNRPKKDFLYRVVEISVEYMFNQKVTTERVIYEPQSNQ